MHETLVRLGAWMPFGQDTKFMKEMIGVNISKSRSVRYTEAAGAAYVKTETEEAERIEKEAPQAPRGAEKMVMSGDGAMVPLIHGEWAEVKTLVIGEVAPAVKEKGEMVVHTEKLSYFSRLIDAERFQLLSLVEVQRRGIENSPKVAMLGDGSDWIQHLADYHRQDSLRILDFPHAGQRVGEIGQALWDNDSTESGQWITKKLHQLKHEGPTQLLVELCLLQEKHPDVEMLEKNIAYLRKREAQMQYPGFEQAGWPIASSIVESANKLVVEVRLKGSGMHWKRENVDPMLALRNIICSDRWGTEWSRIVKRLRSQKTLQQKQLREKHGQEKLPAAPILPIPLPKKQACKPASEIAETSIQPEAPANPKTQRPAPNHPWRHSPIGRALYSPQPISKN